MIERFGRDLLLLERLAAGGMAEVYRAKRTGHGGFEKIVAVKRILQNYAENEEFKEMFRHEANLCAQLQHPNIVQVFSNGEHQDYLYLVMEFVNGKNVRQLLAKIDRLKQQIPIEIACYIVKEAAKGLDFAHNFKDENTGQELNIVHRDMSPQNIMIGYDGTVKIVDFGIAKASARSDSTKAGVLKGKFGYMSPEQAQGQKLDRRSDIFSLGIILWELLTQRRLFSTDDDMKTLQLVRDCDVMKPSRKNPRIPYALDKIVLKALTKNKSERYATTSEMYRDLTRYLAERHPEFIDTDFSVFMQKVFADNIIQEKEKRDKLALEAPAVLASSKEVETPKKPTADATKVEDLEKTQVSLASLTSAELPENNTALNEVPNVSLDTASVLAENHELKELTLSSIVDPFVNTPPSAKSEIQAGANISLAVEEEEKLSLTQSKFSEVPLQTQKAIHAKPTQNKAKKMQKFVRLALVAAAVVFILLALPSEENTEKTKAPEVPPVAASENKSLDAGLNLPNQNSEPPQITELSTNQAPVAKVEVPVESNVPVTEQSPSKESQKEHSGQGFAKLSEIKPFERDPAGVLPGQLQLQSLPRATELYINDIKIMGDDGNAMGTPLKNVALDAGIYKIRLVNKDLGASWEGEVKIKSERLLRKSVLLVSPK